MASTTTLQRRPRQDKAAARPVRVVGPAGCSPNHGAGAARADTDAADGDGSCNLGLALLILEFNMECTGSRACPNCPNCPGRSSTSSVVPYPNAAHRPRVGQARPRRDFELSVRQDLPFRCLLSLETVNNTMLCPVFRYRKKAHCRKKCLCI